MTLTKADLVRRVHKVDFINKTQASKAVDLLLEIMKEQLAEGESVMISGFGKFVVKDKSPRKGRNPRTGEAIILEARRVVTFKPSGVLRKKINPE